LAAPQLYKRGYWGEKRHTNNMERIVQSMKNASVNWTMYSDAIQRHSIGLSQSIVTEVSNNVMQFGERLIYPIAWKHNHTCVDLNKINTTVFGMEQLTGSGKLTSSKGIGGLLNTTSTPSTFIFHEELPKLLK
jgi:hypothetical protein